MNHPNSKDLEDAANQRSQQKRVRQTSSREAKAFPRKRALAACRVCRVRKIKCNNAKPACSSCAATGACCVYEDYHDISKFDPASLVIIDRLDQIMSSFDKLQQATGLVPVPGQTMRTPWQGETVDRSSRSLDYLISSLKVPSSGVGPDMILAWPVFQNQFVPDFLDREVAQAALEDDDAGGTLSRVDEPDMGNDRISDLIERFLNYVHVKNPVLNIASLRLSAQIVAERGIDWDGRSCLVLLACALGCVGGPLFSGQDPAQGVTPSVSHSPQMASFHHAEIYYQAAIKRLGLLSNGLLSAQCWFFSGVYQMYRLRPFKSWTYFSHASSLLHLHIKATSLRHGGLEKVELKPEEVSLFWTCWKSECDLRAELPLPNSVLSDTSDTNIADRYPYPSPPQPFGFPIFTQFESLSTAQDPGLTQIQAMSWYYYLSDVTLKRLQAQILNTLYQENRAGWDLSQLPHVVRTVAEFEARLEAWLKTLPEIIRFEEWDPAPRYEVVYNLQERVFEVKSWLYRPFVYYAIHNGLGKGTGYNIEEYVHKAITCCLHVIQSKHIRHRHHGTWFASRMVLCAALLIIAAVKAGGIIDYLLDWHDLVNQAISSLEYWESESRDLAKGKTVLKHLLSQLQEQDHRSKGSETG
ncbi:hypothetical protein V1525DRAFT_217083 [Lipomyces kononenkoae]|uniref:Uncharacterized protein n=1 Tax=Lipomyces kononenkoae TaxID=34357 RepID=A0ACC3SYN8_LIPKO